ncbi:Copper amine oxidase N-terminal domain-containing protein [Paenibacillus algorifonticola]|uniref:Copper amine oxidase N-terminal domain-containing protein n=1 Tax=Paenibacillus algorifonticola TaxID=684063 RepID=A0A1I2CNR0_9BACL|nr:copper amine oxidase N-terminal domain-containing protein [Paenibacillus algorifonticola]SFE69762.1 Copper amine oxidase N-terminal domain-containing protein [Paenibacillus algorifonticola]
MLPVNFKRAVAFSPSLDPSIEQNEYMDLDSPAQIIEGSTYVPLRFISQSLGASITWDHLSKQATITLNDKRVKVSMEQPAFEIPSSQKLTVASLKLLSDKLNEVDTISSIKNINTHFKPYFTNSLIQSIIKNKGLQDTGQFEAPIAAVYYTSKPKASVMQSLLLGNGMTGEDTYVTDRISHFVYTDGVWKVDKVSFASRSIPNLGY